MHDKRGLLIEQVGIIDTDHHCHRRLSTDQRVNHFLNPKQRIRA